MPKNSSETKSSCFISRYIRKSEKKSVRDHVCSHLEADHIDREDGNSYCILHFPEEKNPKEFEKYCDRKIKANDFNFQWTNFPDDLYIADKKVEAEANFSNIMVLGSVYLISTTFRKKVDFYNARINGYLEIKETRFESDVSFQEARIHQDLSIQNTSCNLGANFSVIHVYGFSWINKQNHFSHDANFDLSQFNSDASFDNCNFNKASFNRAKFFGEATFDKTKFNQEVRFDNATFARFAGFRETIFNYVCVFDGCDFADETYFYRVEFKDTAYFEHAKFAFNAYEPQPNFGLHFHGCRFHSHTVFQGARFRLFRIISAEFKKSASFSEIRVEEEAIFENAVFESEASFVNARFLKKVSFNNSYFKDSVSFASMGANKVFDGWLELQNTRTDKPEYINFHSVRLQPSWFINSNCRNFVFSHCDWKQRNGKYVDAKSELVHLVICRVPNPERLLRRAARQLADNHEESKNFYTASLLRQIANESKRLQSYGGYKIWTLHWWYWLSSFYGESWQRALVILSAILLLFTIYYHFAFFQICPKNSVNNEGCVVRTLQWDEAAQHSLYTSAFQNIEYRRTLTSSQDILILAEKIFAPLQAALLALAIRRKFMR